MYFVHYEEESLNVVIRRQHVLGSLVYCNYSIVFWCLFWYHLAQNYMKWDETRKLINVEITLSNRFMI